MGKVILVLKIGDRTKTTAYDSVKLLMATEDVEVYRYVEPKRKE